MKNKHNKYIITDLEIKRHLKKSVYKKYMLFKDGKASLNETMCLALSRTILKVAIKRGVTFFSHFFVSHRGRASELRVKIEHGQKLTDSFCYQLVKLEADASSFPSMGARSTENARGYILADFLSRPFIKEDEVGNKGLYIPAVFVSHNDEALDLRLPLIRANEVLNRSSNTFFETIGKKEMGTVRLMVGAEQEYFLVDRSLYNKRLDLRLLDRTLLSGNLLKSQKMRGNYFSQIDEKVGLFMSGLAEKLSKYDIHIKHQHGEVAPMQFEVVPSFEEGLKTADQNVILLSELDSVARKYNLKAIINEKPFKEVNGSGKHLNLSFMAENGENLLDPKLSDNLIFKTFFTAIISVARRYGDLISALTFSRSNSLRLGGNEAPVSVLSVFLGDKLFAELSGIKTDEKQENICTSSNLNCALPKSISDRNRTSPFAFCDNKFELRMVGSSQPIYMILACLTGMISSVLDEFSDKLKATKGDKREMLKLILKERFNDDKLVVFNGDCYSQKWSSEAELRGLKSIDSIFDCLEVFRSDTSISLFKNYLKMSISEIEIFIKEFENKYFDEVLLETRCVKAMLTKNILPRIKQYIDKQKIKNSSHVYTNYKLLSRELLELSKAGEELQNERSRDNLDHVLSHLSEARKFYDSIELCLPADYEPLVSISQILEEL